MNKSKKILFIGHFSSECSTKNMASSAAGDIVQGEIFSSLESSQYTSDATCIALEAMASWPKGPFFVKGKRKVDSIFPSFINIPVFKNLMFCCSVLREVTRFKPNIVVQYNSYFYENILLLALSRFNLKSVCIIQDMRTGKLFKKSARLHDYIANKFLRYFDFVVPVSLELARKIRLNESNFFVFQGGVTSFGRNINIESKIDDYIVFAGSLEKHNGIDKLINAWNEQQIGTTLHIFGRGSLTEYVRNLASKNDFIIYHGFKSQEIVLKYQESAKFNFCLRYSLGLNQDYFFPSKFFNILMCSGEMICNDFKGLPLILREQLRIVEDDLSNLKAVLNVSNASIEQRAEKRREVVLDNFNWNNTVNKIISRLS